MPAGLGKRPANMLWAHQVGWMKSEKDSPCKQTSPDQGELPKHVLVVEDDAILALTIEMTLRDAGIATVEMSSTTESALGVLRREKPDAIVLDVHLADRDDGWAIAELVRSLGPASPRIVFSTGAPRDIPENIAELGCVLEKPYDPSVLVDILRQPKRRGIISRLRSALT